MSGRVLLRNHGQKAIEGADDHPEHQQHRHQQHGSQSERGGHVQCPFLGRQGGARQHAERRQSRQPVGENGAAGQQPTGGRVGESVGLDHIAADRRRQAEVEEQSLEKSPEEGRHGKGKADWPRERGPADGGERLHENADRESREPPAPVTVLQKIQKLAPLEPAQHHGHQGSRGRQSKHQREPTR